MRLWSLHPQYLDPAGLTAAWREALLARAVLRGQTRGYRNHPQLARFTAHASPRAAIDLFLTGIHAEAVKRGYKFDARKLGPRRRCRRIAVTSGQLAHEWRHLRKKLRQRNPAAYRRAVAVRKPMLHPLFRLVPGPIAEWERP